MTTLTCATLVLLGTVLAVQDPRQTFKSGADVVLVDVHVVDSAGEPVRDLRLDDFEVRVAGRLRRVISAELIEYKTPLRGPTREGAPREDVTATDAPRPRRMFVLAVDEHSLQAASARAAVNAAERFLDRLGADDLVGLFAYPTGAAMHDLSSDHPSVRRMLRHVAGLFDGPTGRFNLSTSEILDGASGDLNALRQVLERECRGGACSMGDIRQEAASLAIYLEMRISQSVGALRGLIRALGTIPGRKILVIVSGGLISTDRASGRAQAGAEIAALGREAALANTAVFALHLDWSFLEAVSTRQGFRSSYFRDSNLAATGLEMVAGTAGGAVIRVQGDAPDRAFDRILRETSAHYLLGVETDDADRSGQARTIRVRVKRPGLQVRSRTELVGPR